MKDLKEGIAKIYYQYSMCGIPDEYELEWANETECTKQACYAFTDYILTYLKSQGVVRLVENQDWKLGDPIDNANFKRVEELI